MALSADTVIDPEEIEEVTISTPWGPLEVEYKPSLVNLANDVADNADDPDAPSVIARSLCEMLVSWKFTGPFRHPKTQVELVPEGQEVPLDPEIVQLAPYALLSAVLQGLIRSESPNQVRRRNKSRRRS